jgi:hypothetical protein
MDTQCLAGPLRLASQRIIKKLTLCGIVVSRHASDLDEYKQLLGQRQSHDLTAQSPIVVLGLRPAGIAIQPAILAKLQNPAFEVRDFPGSTGIAESAVAGDPFGAIVEFQQ